MNNLIEYKGYFAKVEFNDEDSVFFGTVEGIVDSISFEGQSVVELKEAYHDAIDDYLDMCERLGKEPDKFYKGSFNVRISQESHKKAVLIASSEGITLNQFVENAIKESIKKVFN